MNFEPVEWVLVIRLLPDKRCFLQIYMNIDVPFNSTLDILVENLGRINYGAQITNNLKGITTPVTINGIEITGNWEMYKLPMSDMPDLKAFSASYTAGQPVIYEGEFKVSKPGDTFLDMQMISCFSPARP